MIFSNSCYLIFVIMTIWEGSSQFPLSKVYAKLTQQRLMIYFEYSRHCNKGSEQDRLAKYVAHLNYRGIQMEARRVS